MQILRRKSPPGQRQGGQADGDQRSLRNGLRSGNDTPRGHSPIYGGIDYLWQGVLIVLGLLLIFIDKKMS